MNLNKLQYTTFTVLLIALIIIFLLVAKSILAPLLIALYIATALWPAHKKLKKATRSNILSASLIVMVLGTIFSIVVLTFSYQANKLLKDFPNLTERMDHSLKVVKQNIPKKFNFNLNLSKEEIKEQIMGAAKGILGYTSSFLSEVNAFMSGLVLIPIYVFCLLIYHDQFKIQVKKVLPYFGFTTPLFIESFKEIIQNYLKGLSLVTLILGASSSLVLMAIGVPYAIFLGFFVGFCCIIPYVGILISGLFVMFISYLTQNSLQNIFIIFLSFGLIQFIEGNFLTPKIIGEKVNLNPMLGIIALLVGAEIWGIVGMLLSIPTAAILQQMYTNINTQSKI